MGKTLKDKKHSDRDAFERKKKAALKDKKQRNRQRAEE